MPQPLPLTDAISDESSKSIKDNVLEARFGDGYPQRAEIGLNSRRDVWNIVYVWLDDADAATVEAALEAVGRTDYFTWKPFNSATTKKFVVAKDSVTYQFKGELTKISFRLEQF